MGNGVFSDGLLVPPIRVGQGYDLHRLVPVAEMQPEHSPLTLGGVIIANAPFGVVAHSDGDVILHALMDAMLGALALGDIGEHFPPSNPAYRHANSQELLANVVALLRQHGARVVQVDSTVVLETPKLRHHKQAIQQAIAQCLGLPVGQVSVKAKTAEGLGALGASEAVAASVSVVVMAH